MSERELRMTIRSASLIWDWTKALAALSGGGDVNWEGYSGSQDLNATNDPGVGSYEIWGVNSTFKIIRKAFFGEGSYQPVSPAPERSPIALSSDVRAAPNGFMGQVQAASLVRRH